MPPQKQFPVTIPPTPATVALKDALARIALEQGKDETSVRRAILHKYALAHDTAYKAQSETEPGTAGPETVVIDETIAK